MSFAIVEFDGPQKDIAVVHKNWLASNNKCYWPPFWKKSGQLQKAVQTGQIPDTSSWSLFTIHVVGSHYYDTYLEARQYLNKAEITSDFSSNEAHYTIRRKRPIQQEIEHESSEEELRLSTPKLKKKTPIRRTLPLPKPPPPPTSNAHGLGSPSLVSVTLMENQLERGRNLVVSSVQENSTLSEETFDFNEVPGATHTVTLPFQSSYDAVSNSQNLLQTVPSPVITYDAENQIVHQAGHLQPPIQAYSQLPSFAPLTPTTDIYGMLLGLQNGQAVLGAKLDMLLSLVQNPIQSRGQTGASEPVPWLVIPLESMEKFNELETAIIEDSAKKEKLICTLAARGGNNQNQITYRVMSALLQDKLMTEFTFAGHGTKRGFKQTFMLQIVCDAVRRDKKGSVAVHKEIEKAVEYWLKRAPLRIKKVTKKNREDADSDEADAVE